MAKSWYNKHISTKWGIAIFGWLLVSMVLLIPVLGQSQDNRSEAAKKTCKAIKYNKSDAIIGKRCKDPTSSGTTRARTKNDLYKPTAFGCSDRAYFDGGDNCHPAVGYQNIPECKKMTQKELNAKFPDNDKKNPNSADPGRRCEERVKYFSANVDQYGRNNLLKVTNVDNGQAVIVRAIDVGPHCTAQGGTGKRPDPNANSTVYAKFDMSYSALAAINWPSFVKVEKVDNSKTPLGPVPGCR